MGYEGLTENSTKILKRRRDKAFYRWSIEIESLILKDNPEGLGL